MLPRVADNREARASRCVACSYRSGQPGGDQHQRATANSLDQQTTIRIWPSRHGADAALLPVVAAMGPSGDDS